MGLHYFPEKIVFTGFSIFSGSSTKYAQKNKRKKNNPVFSDKGGPGVSIVSFRKPHGAHYMPREICSSMVSAVLGFSRFRSKIASMGSTVLGFFVFLGFRGFAHFPKIHDLHNS